MQQHTYVESYRHLYITSTEPSNWYFSGHFKHPYNENPYITFFNILFVFTAFFLFLSEDLLEPALRIAKLGYQSETWT